MAHPYLPAMLLLGTAPLVIAGSLLWLYRRRSRGGHSPAGARAAYRTTIVPDMDAPCTPQM
jgi:hypothetical protein